jgi:hypothetical protein
MQSNTIKQTLLLAGITASFSSMAVDNSAYDTSKLSNQYSCNSETTLYGESAVDGADICESLTEVEVLFAERFGTVPVVGDNNNHSDLFIYKDRDSYLDVGLSSSSYGKYIEQDPSNANSNGEVYSYLLDSGNVKNQSHEYTHYLDGRFNKDGDYNATDKAAWWTEGAAEYMQHLHWGSASSFVNDSIAYYGRDFSLKTIFSLTKDDYNTDFFNLVHDGGNIALCYFLQEKPGAMDTLLSHSRSGNWSAWSTELNNLEATYCDDFDGFVDVIFDGSKVCHVDTYDGSDDVYLAPSPTPNTNWEHIQSVTIAGINNDSGNDNGYGDYSNLSSIQLANNSAVTLTSSTSYEEDWRVWIDFDNSKTFDADELVYSADNQQSTTGNVSIPASAIGTTTRMRIAMAYSNVSATGGFDGEIEDYTVELVSNADA